MGKADNYSAPDFPRNFWLTNYLRIIGRCRVRLAFIASLEKLYLAGKNSPINEQTHLLEAGGFV